MIRPWGERAATTASQVFARNVKQESTVLILACHPQIALGRFVTMGTHAIQNVRLTSAYVCVPVPGWPVWGFRRARFSQLHWRVLGWVLLPCRLRGTNSDAVRWRRMVLSGWVSDADDCGGWVLLDRRQRQHTHQPGTVRAGLLLCCGSASRVHCRVLR